MPRTIAFTRPRRVGRKKILIYAAVLLLTLGGAATAGLLGYDPGGILVRVGLRQHRIGDVIDQFNGVAVHYNGPVGNVSHRNLTPDGYNLGQAYQCVEFVKRYYHDALHHKMPDSYGHAKDFFNPDIADGAVNPARALLQCANGGAHAPRVGALLVFGPSASNPYGHVAIVSAVEEGEIEIIQQNPGPSAPSRLRMALTRSAGNATIENDRVLGWLWKPAP